MIEVAKNGNFYIPQSCQKLQLFTSWQKLPIMAIFFNPKVAKNGNKWLNIIAKNGNKRNDLQL